MKTLDTKQANWARSKHSDGVSLGLEMALDMLAELPESAELYKIKENIRKEIEKYDEFAEFERRIAVGR